MTADRKTTASSFAPGQAAGHVPAPRPEHVVGAAQPLAVEADFGQGIEAVEDEGETLLAREAGVHTELAPVLPVALGDPLNAQLLVADERVGNAPGGHEIEVHSAGNHGGQPLFRAALAHLPGSVERLLDHASLAPVAPHQGARSRYSDGRAGFGGAAGRSRR